MKVNNDKETWYGYSCRSNEVLLELLDACNKTGDEKKKKDLLEFLITERGLVIY